MSLPYLDEAAVSVVSSDPSTVSRSRSGRKVSRNLEQQKWNLEVTWPEYLDDKTVPLEIALDELKGQSETAGIIHPVRSHHPNARGTWLVSEAASAGTNQAIISGEGVLSLGHFVRFYGHSKVYRITSILGSVVTVFPHLRKDITESETVYVNDVEIEVTRTDDDVTYAREGALTTISSSFEETI